MKWRVYIAGKVGNGSVDLTNAEYNSAFDKFQRVEKMLLNAGFEVRNPMKYVPKDVESWEEAMRITLPILCQCNAIYLIHDWNASRGAQIEYFNANIMRHRLITQEMVDEQIQLNKDKHIYKPQKTEQHA